MNKYIIIIIIIICILYVGDADDDDVCYVNRVKERVFLFFSTGHNSQLGSFLPNNTARAGIAFRT